MDSYRFVRASNHAPELIVILRTRDFLIEFNGVKLLKKRMELDYRMWDLQTSTITAMYLIAIAIHPNQQQLACLLAYTSFNKDDDDYGNVLWSSFSRSHFGEAVILRPRLLLLLSLARLLSLCAVAWLGKQMLEKQLNGSILRHTPTYTHTHGRVAERKKNDITFTHYFSSGESIESNT